MEVGRLLKEWAVRTERGWYKMKPELIQKFFGETFIPVQKHNVKSVVGAPEIRDMGWSSKDVRFEDSYLKQVTEHNKHLQDLLAEAKTQCDVLNVELNLKDQKIAQANFYADRLPDWDKKLVTIRKMLSETQHAEVGHVYSMCDDTIWLIDSLLRDIRGN